MRGTGRVGEVGGAAPRGGFVVHVGTFPPRECGIATFTQDLTDALDEFLAPAVRSKILALDEAEAPARRYPAKVIGRISQPREEDYAAAAERLNQDPRVALVSIQHEFGIFGGPDGAHLQIFVDRLTAPVVITFHTVLPDPSATMRAVVAALAARAAYVVVMTEASAATLAETCGVDRAKIRVVPHGIHPVTYVAPEAAKRGMKLSGKATLATFGLLGPGKGIEHVIDALPGVVAEFPDALYLVLGATHPVVLRRDGEAYRDSLAARAEALGVSGHVRFVNRYFPVPELLRYLKATDVYLSPSQNPNQAVSGTLSYALGAGRPVVSTAFVQAKEDITPDVGELVGFGSGDGFRGAILNLLRDPARRLALGKNAYFRTRRMTWPNVAIEYAKIFSLASPRLASARAHKKLPPVKLAHMLRLTTDFGIIQFAHLAEPELSSGYTLDDNARALQVAVGYMEATPAPASAARRRLARAAETYLAFVGHCQNEDGGFDNYFREDRTRHDALNRGENLEDAAARGALGLAFAATSLALRPDLRALAAGHLERFWASPSSKPRSPRAKATHLKALASLVARGFETSATDLRAEIRRHCDDLVDLYERSRDPEWEWFEENLTYSNALLPEALLAGYEVLREPRHLEAARATLDFLIGKSFAGGVYVPIGQASWHRRGGERAIFDQQPEDAAAMALALRRAADVTGDSRYGELSREAFDWFLGGNVLNRVVYDRTTGGCHDGVRETQVNLNQGAESTLSYLLARLLF